MSAHSLHTDLSWYHQSPPHLRAILTCPLFPAEELTGEGSRRYFLHDLKQTFYGCRFACARPVQGYRE
jgi:hypothetical protein